MKNQKGISIRKLNYIMAAATIIVSVVVLVFSQMTFKAYQDLIYTVEDYTIGQKSAADMQGASDYLTEEVRSFVETGERVHIKNYFEESRESKTREQSLQAIVRDFDDPEIRNSLDRAVRYSMELMETEYYAMRLRIEADGWDIGDYVEYPDVSGIVLKDEHAALTAEKKAELARSMVFDDEYHQAKENISSNTKDCLDRLLVELDVRQKNSTERVQRNIWTERVLIIVLIVIVLTIVVLTMLQVIMPLIRAIPNIQSDKPIPISGAAEFRFLANTYNRMYEDNRENKQRLEYEASHDQLTGAFNRNGFEKTIKEIDFTNAAFALIDVDRFKSINDNFGHEAGDRVLSHVAEVVRGCFKDDDILCRIGGDEFALFITEVAEADKPSIVKTFRDINESLAKGGDGLPPISVSAGVAFGTGINDGHIYKRADKALYHVKAGGRADIAFG
ncbi:MAG: GGDEF domain-containing protein [Clostridia bacterium]|nr:GGDEF domain-containing protein [Clostridia bacterium]